MAPRTRANATRFHRAALFLPLLAAAACRGPGGSEADSARSPRTAAAASAALVPALPECPNTTGRWDECNVRQRLERAGLAPQPLPDTLHLPFLDRPGVGYGVGHAVLYVFLYDSAGALTRDLADVDTLSVQARSGGAPVAWQATPNLITSNNLAAVLVSDQATQIERVRLALTAGLPAPTPKK